MSNLSSKRRADLTTGSVRGHLIRMTSPMILGLLAMMSINMVDTWFVALLGTEQLAAMSFTFPVIMVLISVGIGVMAGTSSVISRVIGSGDEKRVRRLCTDSIILTSLFAIVFAAIGLLTIDPLFRLLGADDLLLPLIRQYMTVWYLGYIVFLVPMAGMGAIRATGDTKRQSNLMIVAAVINLVLDPILIFGWLGFPALGIEGAALASVIGRGAAMILGYRVLRDKELLTFERARLAEIIQSWKDILHVGLPAIGTNLIIPLSTGVLLSMVAVYGSTAVAGYGAATRVESLLQVIFYALSGVIGPFVGQNLGAGRCDRIKEAQIQSAILSVCVGVVLAVVVVLFATPLVSLFSDQKDVINNGTLYLFIVPLTLGPAGIIMVINAAFNGLGKPMPAVAVSTIRMFLVMVPASWIGGQLFGLGGIYCGLALANIIAAILAFKWFSSSISSKTVEQSAT